MPLAAPRPCNAPLCPTPTRERNGFCTLHQDRARKPWEGSAWQRRRKEGASRWQWAKLRERVLKRDGYLCRCEECRSSGDVREAHEVDHIVPLARGGTDDPSNLQAISRQCHRIKSQRESRCA